MTTLGLVALVGTGMGLGLFLTGVGLSRPSLRLADALASLDGVESALDYRDRESSDTPPGLEGLGAALQRRLRLPVTENQQRLLLLQSRSVGDFFAEKLVWTTAGVLMPTLWGVLQFMLGQPVTLLPLGISLVGGITGYFIADWRLAHDAGSARQAATHSIHTFFDLVALERLAGASAAQAVASAASVSEAPLFRRIAAGLERARLEQGPPWDELARIGRDWQLPELVDFADVMRLEEQGAALADALQARVRELRNSHLSRQQAEAQEATEGLTIWMTVPALLLGLAFVIPPLLRLSSG